MRLIKGPHAFPSVPTHHGIAWRILIFAVAERVVAPIYPVSILHREFRMVDMVDEWPVWQFLSSHRRHSPAIGYVGELGAVASFRSIARADVHGNVRIRQFTGFVRRGDS